MRLRLAEGVLFKADHVGLWIDEYSSRMLSNRANVFIIALEPCVQDTVLHAWVNPSSRPLKSKLMHLNSQLEEVIQTLRLSLSLHDVLAPDVQSMSSY